MFFYYESYVAKDRRKQISAEILNGIYLMVVPITIRSSFIGPGANYLYNILQLVCPSFSILFIMLDIVLLNDISASSANRIFYYVNVFHLNQKLLLQTNMLFDRDDTSGLDGVGKYENGGGRGNCNNVRYF